MQAFSSAGPWSPPSGTLGELTRASHERAAHAASRLEELRAMAQDARPARPFATALRGDHIRVIGEVKRASPSKGPIAPGLDAASQARQYLQGGAAAVSVLTEPSRFGGALDDVSSAAEAVDLPVIRKDFLVHPVQLWEARAFGASAALLIVRSLDDATLRRLIDEARECGLETLVEVRDERELARALAADARVIGVNNRNLETLVIDPRTAPSLIPAIPSDRIAVAESGMRTRDDVAPAAAAGADAILVGSALSSASDPSSALAALASIARVTRRTLDNASHA